MVGERGRAEEGEEMREGFSRGLNRRAQKRGGGKSRRSEQKVKIREP